MLHFTASNLLFETKIEEQNLTVNKYQDIATLFPVLQGALPFDPFAASFYLTTRYEEYIQIGKTNMAGITQKPALLTRTIFYMCLL